MSYCTRCEWVIEFLLWQMGVQLPWCHSAGKPTLFSLNWRVLILPWKINGMYWCDSISGLCSVPLIQGSVLSPIPCLDYLTLWWILKSGSKTPPTLFYFKTVFVTLVSLLFLINCRIGLLIKKKKPGGRSKREVTYVDLWLIHVDIWQKPTQYCKAVILQLKINKF